MGDSISYDNRDGVVVITLNRPDNRNALDADIMEQLAQVLRRLHRDSDARVAVMTGAGSAFSAGANLKKVAADGLASLSTNQVRSYYRTTVHPVPLAFHELEVPVIAAVNGPAFGAGCDIACMCDIRIAADTASFCEVFVKLGVASGDGGAWFLPRLIGPSRYAEMAFTGDPVSAEQALEWGLVSKVVPGDQLMPEATALATRIAANPPAAVRMMKRLIREGDNTRLESHLELCATFNAIGHGTADHQEALDAFLQKRTPNFTGE